MSTNYPSSLDTWSAKTDNVDTVYSADVNQPNDAAIALETKLGTGASTPTSGKLLRGSGTGTSDWGITLDTDGTLAGNSDTSVASQKAVRTYADTLTLTGWLPADGMTYASATTFTVSGDQTAKYSKGTKLKLTNSTVKYFYVVSSSYSSPNTTVTVTGGGDYSLASAAITSPYYSYSENPQGFPNYFSFTQTITAESGSVTTASGTIHFTMVGARVFFKSSIAVSSNGTGAIKLRATIPVSPASVNEYPMYGWNASTGLSLTGSVASTYIQISKYDNTYPVGDGHQIRVSGSYLI